MIPDGKKEFNTTEKESQPIPQKERIDKYVDAYFDKGVPIESHDLPLVFFESVKGALLIRHEKIQALMKSDKNIEYAQRIISGEPINLSELSPNMGYAIRYLVENTKKQRVDEKSESIKTLEFESLETLMEYIPSKYRNFPAELIEDFWVEPIRVDDPSDGRDFIEKKSYILKQIARQQEAEANESEIFNLRKKLGESFVEKADEKESSIEKQAPSVDNIHASQELVVELNQKIELDSGIERKSHQEVFGDSNGSYTGFIEHLRSRNIIDIDANSEPVWIGGNMQANFLGDILGDRTPEGEQIYVQLMKLREMARKEGGDVIWLAGNHDNMYNAMLFGFSTEYGVGVEKDMNKRLTNYVGNLEPAYHLPDNILNDYFAEDSIENVVEKILNGNSDIQETITRRTKVYKKISENALVVSDLVENYKKSIEELEYVLEYFKTTFENPASSSREKIKAFIRLGDGLPKYALVRLGKEILDNRESILQNIKDENPLLLEGIYEQKLISIENDVLSCHTNFTKNMILLIENHVPEGGDFSDGVASINAFYQNTLKWYGSSEPRTPQALSEEHMMYFNALRDEFISTSSESRINYSEDPRVSEAEKKQITLRLKQHGINAILHGHNDESGNVLGTNDLPILSIDRGAYKGSEGLSTRPTAVASINTDGMLSYF